MCTSGAHANKHNKPSTCITDTTHLQTLAKCVFVWVLALHGCCETGHRCDQNKKRLPGIEPGLVSRMRANCQRQAHVYVITCTATDCTKARQPTQSKQKKHTRDRPLQPNNCQAKSCRPASKQARGQRCVDRRRDKD